MPSDAGKNMRKYDLIVFGATGFTGKYLLEVIAKALNSGHGEKFTYAVAARSESRLEDILDEVSNSTGLNLRNVPKIAADISDQDSLVRMAKLGTVVLNCVGPIFTGKQEVVDACIEAGTHCVDLNGNPLLTERIQRDCDDIAKKKNVYIVQSCGFDTIPVDMGVVHLQQNFGGDLNSVESYMHTDNKEKPVRIHFATFESILHGLANAKLLKPIRKSLERIEPIPPKPERKLAKRSIMHKSNVVNGWCLPYPRSDIPVVTRTQNILYRFEKQRPVQILSYLNTVSFMKALGTIIGAMFLGMLIYFPFGLGRRLLLKFPRAMTLGYVTREGPSREEMDNLEFTVTLYGQGWPEKKEIQTEKPSKSIILKITGTNPGYGASSICMLQAALTILKEKDKMPLNGGVYPPGAAFAKTDLVKRLHNNGVYFQIIDC